MSVVQKGRPEKIGKVGPKKLGRISQDMTNAETEMICHLDGQKCDGACDRYGVECDPIEVRLLPPQPGDAPVMDLDFAWEVDDERA